MTSPAFDLQVPVTEIQIAEAICVSDSNTANIIRRLAYQRGVLIYKLGQLQAVVDAGQHEESVIRLTSKTEEECDATG